MPLIIKLKQVCQVKQVQTLTQCLQGGNLHFKDGKKIITAFVFILQGRKDVIKSNWGFSVHLAPLNHVKPKPTGRTSAFTLYECKNDMLSEVRMENFWNINY